MIELIEFLPVRAERARALSELLVLAANLAPDAVVRFAKRSQSRARNPES